MKIQINDEVRDATAEETARIEQIRAAVAAKEAAFNAARDSALNKLKTLGLTDAEIAALVG